MPIDSKHPFYRAYENQWTDCRDAYEGQAAVKLAGERYLPKLSGQTGAEYLAYKTRALFYSITSKTLSALVGMAMDEPPELQYPDKMKPYFEDHAGVQFYESLARTIQEVLLMGRFGILVDRPAAGGAPYLTMYLTEDIINWRLLDDGTLDMVILREAYLDTSSEDEYVQEVKIRYRKLEMRGDVVSVSVHTTVRDAQEFQTSGITTITNMGLPMKYIPFFGVTPEGLGINPTKPPMQDIVDINLSHYRTSADLEHGRHFTGLPTPYVIGAESQASMHIGSTKAWVIPDSSAKVGFLEFTGQGLQSLEKALSEKQAQLASLSARLIDNSTRGSEAAETVKLRYLSETSSLRAIVRAAQAFMNKVYGCIADMEGFGATSVNIVLNTNFLDAKLSATELTAWVNAYLQRGISKEIFVHALKVGRALPPPGEPMGEIPDPPEPVAPTDPKSTSSKPAKKTTKQPSE